MAGDSAALCGANLLLGRNKHHSAKGIRVTRADIGHVT